MRKILLQKQSGAITLDFIFAFLLVFSFTLILGIFSFTLSVAESIQYLTFSASRAYFAGHVNPEKQIELGEKKFDELKKTGSYQKLLRKDWFDTKLVGLGDFSSDYTRVSNNDILEGARTEVTIGLLDFNIPLFGSTENDTGKYKTFLTSFIGRESTSDECMAVISERYEQLLNLDSYQAGSINPGSYVVFDDNGC